MNPFESARTRARDARALLTEFGVGPYSKGADLVQLAAKKWNLAIRKVPHGNPLLRGADATINVKRRWIVVRKDVSDETFAFLVAHELGHFFLHHVGHATYSVVSSSLDPATDDDAATRYVEAYGPRERQELQANVFAREFLFPRDSAIKAFVEDRISATAIREVLKIPLELVRLQLLDSLLLPAISSSASQGEMKAPTDAQRPAVESEHRYTQVVAGPGTGKTATLLFRVQRLLQSKVEPESIVILTFSNKAAAELVERLKLIGLEAAARVWVGTFHSFGLEFLRKFGARLSLTPRLSVVDQLGALTVLEKILPSLPLRHFDPLSDPVTWLPDVLDTISRCKDDLLT